MGKEVKDDITLDTALEWRDGDWHLNRDVALAEILRRVKDIEKIITEKKEEK